MGWLDKTCPIFAALKRRIRTVYCFCQYFICIGIARITYSKKIFISHINFESNILSFLRTINVKCHAVAFVSGALIEILYVLRKVFLLDIYSLWR